MTRFSGAACPSCGASDWHDRGCPELRRKRRQFLPVIVVPIVITVGLSLLTSGSIGPLDGWFDGLIGGAIGCIALAFFLRWRRSVRSPGIARGTDDA